jgi:hypothetical protein
LEGCERKEFYLEEVEQTRNSRRDGLALGCESNLISPDREAEMLNLTSDFWCVSFEDCEW